MPHSTPNDGQAKMVGVEVRRPVVLLDLDNCIANDAHRIPLIDWSKTGDERYAAYHAASGSDDACMSGLTRDILHCAEGHPLREAYLSDVASARVFILTARPTLYAEQTRAWLDRHQLRYESVIHRNPGDKRKSASVKRWQLEQLCLHTDDFRPGDIIAALDDRPEIVEMYRSLGLPAAIRYLHALDAYTPPEHPAPAQDSQHPVVNELQLALRIFAERNALYKDNWQRFGEIMLLMFGGRIPEITTSEDANRLQLFMQLLNKLTRYADTFAAGGHKDSARDAIVYSAMLATETLETP